MAKYFFYISSDFHLTLNTRIIFPNYFFRIIISSELFSTLKYTSMSSSGNTGNDHKAVFQNMIELNFDHTAKDQYQLRVITVDVRLFVGVSKLAFDSKKKEFVYTKKNVFMPKSVWDNFVE